MARRRSLRGSGPSFAEGALGGLSQALQALMYGRMVSGRQEDQQQAQLALRQQTDQAERARDLMDRVVKGELMPQQAVAMGLPEGIAQALFSQDRAYQTALGPTLGAKSPLDVQSPEAVVSALAAQGIDTTPTVGRTAMAGGPDTLPSTQIGPASPQLVQRGLSAAKSRQEQILGEEGRQRQAGIQEAGDKARAVGLGSGRAEAEIATETLPFRTQEARDLALAQGQGRTSADKEALPFEVDKAGKLAEATFADFLKRQNVQHGQAKDLATFQSGLRIKEQGQAPVTLPAALAERVASAQTSMATLDRLRQLYRPEYIGPLAGRQNQFIQGMPGMSADQGFAEFSAETATLKNAIIKAITGAQMSEPEAKRIMQQVPDVTDKPEVWIAKAASTERNLKELMARTLQLGTGRSDLMPDPMRTSATIQRPGQVPTPAADPTLLLELDPITGKLKPAK